MALDRAFGLNERLSTALTLPEDLRETPAGRALIADAIRHVADLDVADRFGLSIPRRAWVPIIPALLAGVILLVPEWSQAELGGNARASATPEDDKQVVTKQTETLGKKMAEQRKADGQAEVRRGREAPGRGREDRQRPGQGPARREGQGHDGPEQADRRPQGPPEAARLARAGQPPAPAAQGHGQQRPGRRLRQGPRQGRLREGRQGAQAAQGEARLRQDDREGEGGPQAAGRRDGQQLQKLANLDQRKKQLEEAKKNGGLSKEQFDKEMAKLNDQAKNLEKLQKMASQLAKAERGDGQGRHQEGRRGPRA